MEEFKLDRFQEEAIAAAQSGNSVIVSAPTGAGKTLIAERIIDECIGRNRGVIYTAPIKALSNQKFRDFSKKYPDMVGILTGDVSINRGAPILIMTTEIFRNAILVNPEEFAQREWVIFDEIHYLDDIERGTVWEEAIILLPPNMRMLALSATIPNIKGFVDWLTKIHKWPIKAIIEENRPVPLHFFFQCNNEVFTNLNELKKLNLLTVSLNKKIMDRNNPRGRFSPIKANRLHPLMHYLKNNKALPCVYFSFSRRRCEELAGEAASFDLLTAEEKIKITTLFDELVDKFNLPLAFTNFLCPLIQRGIAYHHAGLLPTLKEIIERLFTSGLIKMIFTTETFALGINMPAKSVVFDDMSKFYGFGHRFLKTRDFYQMAGRAGRRGIDTEGFVFSRINPNYIDMPTLEKIIHGQYEPITSQFNSCYATVLNLYKLMGEKIYDIYPLSFHFHQTEDWRKKEALQLLKGRVDLLKSMGYIQNGKLSRKAELASQVYSFELIVSELFERGFFDNLSEESLFIVITALVYEPRKNDFRPPLNKQLKKLRNDLSYFTNDIHRVEKKFRINPLSKIFYFHLSEAGRAWFQEKDFYKVTQICKADEGEIVRYFRMGIQVLREIYHCPAINPKLKEKVFNCLKRINRDVVDAEKQLRQEI